MKNRLFYLIKWTSILSLQMVLINTAMAQNRTITGRVTSSDDGIPIPGVNIIEEGTDNGAVTDFDGEYSIEVSVGATLVFSALGFTTIEVIVAGDSSIDVEMAPDLEQLSEVVVVGYGRQRKATLTGSVVAVEGETLEKTPTLSLSNSFAGRLPGITAQNTTGEPGADVADLLIRGASTLGSTAPLFVIDGVPGREGFNQINPRDVESVSVLKDASAAIYGSRAANGVIIITTKRGRSGKPSFSYSFNQGFTTPTRIPEYANSETLAIFQNEQLRLEGQTERWTPEEIQLFREGSDPVNYPNTDWAEVALKDYSTQSRHDISVRGGSDAVRYFISGNYSNREGIFRDGINNFNVLGGRSNIDADITDNLTISADLSFQEENRLFPGVETNYIVRAMWRNYPFLVDFYPNGLPGVGVERGDNPRVMASDAAGYRRNKTNLYQTRLSFDLNIPQVEGLGIDGFIAYDKNASHLKHWQTPYSLYDFNAETGEYEESSDRFVSAPELMERYDYQENWIVHAKIKYQRTFGGHEINSFVATEMANEDFNYFSAERRNFISPAIDQLYAGGESNQITDGSASEFARRNYFGRLGYAFEDKYLMDVNVRYDGSSAFPKENRWGLFPGISVGWVASEESFIKNNASFINHLKIRGSWGKMGNDAIDPFQYLASYGFTSGYFLGQGRSLYKGLTQQVAPNPNITWEVATTTNIGIDATLWDGLFGMTLDVFKTRRDNILTARNASIPDYTGLILPLENIGVVENRGFEIALSHRNQVGDLSYSINPNMSFARNRVIDIDEPENVLEHQRRTGHPMGAGLFLIPTGIYRTQAEIDNSPHVPGTVVNDLQYQDVNNDGTIDDDDRVRLDKTNIPEIVFGTQMTMDYRNFDLAVLLQGQTNVWRYIWMPQGLFGNVLQEIVENRPTPDNPNSVYPNITYDNSQVSALDSQFWLRDASFIRLKSLEVGYSLSQTTIEQLGLDQFRFFVNGFNLITLDKLKWFDPEGQAERGDFYPQNRIFNVGFNVTF